MKDMKYSDKIHLVGRAGSIMSLCIMLGIPALICAVYDIWPTIGEVVSIGSGLLAILCARCHLGSIQLHSHPWLGLLYRLYHR